MTKNSDLQAAKDKLKWNGLYNKTGIKAARSEVNAVQARIKWEGIQRGNEI